FRNALVRANYANLQKGISENPVFLEKFFRNLLLGEHNELKNRETHIDYTGYTEKNSKKTSVKIDENFGVKEKSSVQTKKNFGTNEKTSVQILELIKADPKITLQEIAEKTNRSKRAIEMQVKKLRENGVLRRVGATKNGHWEIVEVK
ncbi:winged helix-turn-helix transcriptional regulator, partial [bacterium]|nr:winged helix-turn-helix transcriptional regulator [bacterium]